MMKADKPLKQNLTGAAIKEIVGTKFLQKKSCALYEKSMAFVQTFSYQMNLNIRRTLSFSCFFA